MVLNKNLVPQQGHRCVVVHLHRLDRGQSVVWLRVRPTLDYGGQLSRWLCLFWCPSSAPALHAAMLVFLPVATIGRCCRTPSRPVARFAAPLLIVLVVQLHEQTQCSMQCHWYLSFTSIHMCMPSDNGSTLYGPCLLRATIVFVPTEQASSLLPAYSAATGWHQLLVVAIGKAFACKVHHASRMLCFTCTCSLSWKNFCLD